MRRYQEILALKDKGLSNSEIADRFEIDPNSVKVTLLRYADPTRHAAYKEQNRAEQARRRERRVES